MKIKYDIMSYTQSLYHVILTTYRRRKTICEEHERELYAVIMKESETLKAKVFRIGGMPEHVHILVSLPSYLPISKYVQEVKCFTSRWLSENPNFPKWQRWTREYAAFSKSERDKNTIINYIKRQKSHHKSKIFDDEYRKIVTDNGITIDERYFLSD